MNIDPYRAPSPSYIVDTGLLKENLSVLADVKARSGAKVLLALKGFAMFSLFPLIREELDGICASGLYEAKLGAQEFGKSVHTYSPAYTDVEMEEILEISNHVTFNSFNQWRRFQPLIESHQGRVEFGLRVNPEHSEAEVDLYNPCAPGSRLGIRRAEFDGADLTGVSGLHFHVLCEQNAEPLERTLKAFEEAFGEFLPQLKWVNFGGGHHITREDYNRELLIKLVKDFRERYDLDVYLEPGEAVALNTGVLIASVEDVAHNDVDIAILNISCTCHMPDVLEMPYRPEIDGAEKPGEKAYTYRLAGNSCLAGDVIGDYSFDQPLTVGSRLVFMDMAHYTMVKTTMFNGVKHPAIGYYSPEDDKVTMVREFTYDDYRNRLS